MVLLFKKRCFIIFINQAYDDMVYEESANINNEQ